MPERPGPVPSWLVTPPLTPSGTTSLAFARKSQRTVVVAHNLAYDLRISGGLDYLPQHGWEVHRPMFANNRVSLEARKDDAPLVLVDSLTLIPQGLAAIGVMLGDDKPELPDDDAPVEQWWERCEADVAISCARAYMEIVDWLAREDHSAAGPRTGPGIGWHVMLRRGTWHDKVLVHNRPEVRDAEAAAMYAGRAEVWKHGNLKGGPWYEWDYALAYANVCAQNAHCRRCLSTRYVVASSSVFRELGRLIRGWSKRRRLQTCRSCHGRTRLEFAGQLAPFLERGGISSLGPPRRWGLRSR